LHRCVDFEVVFPGYDRGKLRIPTEHLAHVFEIVRRGLYRAAVLLEDVHKKSLRSRFRNGGNLGHRPPTTVWMDAPAQ
jgi:hypothetical protein